MAVVVGSFVEADTLLDSEGIDLLINGVVDVTAVTTAADTFVYAVGPDDNGLSCFTLGANGTLTNIQNIQNSAPISLVEASLVTSATIGGRAYVYVMGGAGESLSTFEVGTSGQLTFLGRVNDSGLAGPSLDDGNEMNTFTAGGKTYLYVRGGELFTNEGGLPVVKDLVNIIELGSNGLPASTFTAPLGDNLADDAVAVTVGARTFLVECVPRAPLFGIPSAMGCYEVLADGSLQLTDALVNSSSAPVDLAAAVVGGTNYVVAATIFNTGPTALTVFKVDGNGALSVVSDYGGTTDDPYLGAAELVSFTLGGETFVAAIVSLTTNVTRVDVLRLDATGSLTLVSQHAIPSTFSVGEASLRIVDGSVVFISADAQNSALHTFVLGAGADILTGGNGDDNLVGFAGDDVLNGSAGSDIFDGGQGSDWASYQSAPSSVAVALDGISPPGGTSGDAVGDIFLDIENLRGSQFGDWLRGNAGNNVLDGKAGADTLNGLGGNDTYYVDNAGDTIVELSGGGDDRVSAQRDFALGAGQEVELITTTNYGAVRNIDLKGNEFAQTIVGNNGNNWLHDGGVGGADTLRGREGNDFYTVYNSSAAIIEVKGQGDFDRLAAGVDYVLAQGVEIESLRTTSMHAIYSIDLTGNEFGQQIIGNDGDNRIDGKGGNDTIQTGLGNDIVVFSAALDGSTDKITDFIVTDDQIALDSSIFTALSVGALDASAFKDNILSPRDADDKIIYNSNTGSLFYDADGLGGAVAVKFTSLATGLALTSVDFVVI
ncbi:calcium-binding protein [Mesorhizobium sp. IMUNJ 23232]|uniref:calcium-binding protein n=1 Tax=Mesorhizobium sp. IMUNJ 23232 TaxID=3376064 RepID=UPI00379DBFAB